MVEAVAARSILRSASTSVKSSVSRISSGAKPSSTGATHSPFRIRTQKPQSRRIFRQKKIEESEGSGENENLMLWNKDKELKNMNFEVDHKVEKSMAAVQYEKLEAVNYHLLHINNL
ncbi:unnamed protein product [Lactuca virosa]|uniref:Uncharacterized protein n=1 Tax=Lactuca virosa TaxID=75947 RepID=A0AAU9NQG3_9ASTR|nr:unnamed protein product [Lactuca virosa]